MTTRMRSSTSAAYAAAAWPSSRAAAAKPPGEDGQHAVAEAGEQQPGAGDRPLQRRRRDRVAQAPQSAGEDGDRDRQQTADGTQPGAQRRRDDRAEQDGAGEEQTAQECQPGSLEQRLWALTGHDGL